MEPSDILSDLDLTESETKLYLTLLREGQGTASKLAKKAGIGRRLAYDQIDSLKDKGLVSYIDKENKRIYKPTNPKRLEEIVEDRKQDLEELESQVESLLPQLMRQYNADADERDVKILEGKSGIKQLFNDQLREAEDVIYLIGSPIESEEVLEHFLPSWTKKRKEQGVKIRGIFEQQMRGEVGENAPLDGRFLPEGHDSKVSISIYGDKAGIIFWIEEPLVIMIEDEKAAESFKSYFTLIWEAAEE
ncbi:MAG: helix-turn-helix domain-containing protein [Candidatus Nanohaloarchaea archaeon]|nr:helix-turn-helix domain-containing protein [Candidatus Nanohaloarchaea archaeon]